MTSITDFKYKEYYTEDSAYIQQFTAGGYVRRIAKKDSLYFHHNKYDENGLLKYRSKIIRNGAGAFGKWYTYDEKGNVTKVEDEDEKKGYTFKFEDVLTYAKKNNIDLHKASIYKESGGWAIEHTGYFEGEYNKYLIILDKQTGEKDITVGFYSGKKAGPSEETLATYDTLYYKGVRYPRE